MIYVIVGPTASGKSDVAHKLAGTLNCDLINCDAFQIYKGMNIGTNKVSSKDKIYSKYHLLDIVTPDKSFSVKEYQDMFRETISHYDINKENIVVVGGTGLYLRASLYDYEFKEENYSNIDYSKFSNEELFEKLRLLDEDATKTIHPNNRKRVIRALSIIENSGVKKSDIIASQQHELVYPRELIKIFFINPERESLYEKINARVDEMINNGLIDEVKSLLNKYELSNTASQGIGYKEVISYLNNEISLENCRDLIKKRTRNYAKRQVTFFKHQFDCIEVKDGNDIIEMVKQNG